MQPRRGKNLPFGGLDSRAKKLHREDGDDFEFSIKWINENAHNMYKDQHNTVVGVRDLSEVSLCKAHSSTLYRAKKRHERLNGPESIYHSTVVSGGLAAKVREIAFNNTPDIKRDDPMPDFSSLSHSTSSKRKRIIKTSPKLETRPSVSTPLYGSRNNHGFVQPNFPSQLPPLHQQYSKPQIVIETVSLKASDRQMYYYFRNLAITDSFTFRDLLAEIDMTGSPPQGKRIVISDADKFYPLDQAIRSVIRRPLSTHLELSLGLTDKPSINWSTY